MSVYSVKGKGWRYDFTLMGTRHTKGWFKTKKDAQAAETYRREELKNPLPQTLAAESVTDMAFLDLLNLRLDHVQSYNSPSHYRDVLYHCKRWAREWKDLSCSKVTARLIESHLKNRWRTSALVANKDLQYLRALFNYGVKKKLIPNNPTDGIDFFPIEKRKKYIPPKEDLEKVISAANPEAQQYLLTIILTAARGWRN
jgi:site-specific recombinase XerD